MKAAAVSISSISEAIPLRALRGDRTVSQIRCPHCGRTIVPTTEKNSGNGERPLIDPDSTGCSSRDQPGAYLPFGEWNTITERCRVLPLSEIHAAM